MATVYRKKYPIPMPEGVEIITRKGQKMARWTSGKNQVRIAEVLDDRHVQFVSDCWYIRFRDAAGITRRESTGCRDRQAAERILHERLAKVEKVKSGVMSREEMTAAQQLDTPLGQHVKDYLSELAIRTVRGRRISPAHVRQVRDRLNRIIRECGFRLLRDVTRQTIQRWMLNTAALPRDPEDKDSSPLAARTINMHRSAMIALCNWCVSEGRLVVSPLTGLAKAEETEPARKRRPLNEDEIGRLLRAARERPLLDALTVRRGKNRGKLMAKIRPEVQQQLKRLGEERALAYKFMILTGLRAGETASITASAFCLDAATPHLIIEGRHAKSGRSATLPLRPDLVDDLRQHLARLAQDHGGHVPHNMPLFRLGQSFLHAFNRDLAAAGILKCDAQGRTVDVHSLRHTFATLLARSGVSRSVAQKLMRHSDIRLTMGLYTHLDLADTASAVLSLPMFKPLSR